MQKSKKSFARKIRCGLVYAKKNFIKLFTKVVIIYLIFSLWLVISKYQFNENSLSILPFYFHVWTFTNILGASALTVVIFMWIALVKRNPLGYFVIQAILFAQVISTGWLLSCLGNILAGIEGILAGLLFYYMGSKRIKAKFKVVKMNWIKLYSYIFIVLAVISYFQYRLQVVGYLIPTEYWEKITIESENRSNLIGFSPDGKIRIHYIDYDEKSIKMYKTDRCCKEETFLQEVKLSNKYGIRSMALSQNEKYLAVGYALENEASLGFEVYDLVKKQWKDEFKLSGEEKRKNVAFKNIEGIYNLEFNEDNRYLAVMGTFGIEFWDLKQQKMIKRIIETVRDKVYWLENTKYIRITNQKIYLGDLSSNEAEQVIIEADSYIKARVSLDKKYIAVFSNKGVPSFFVWDIEKQRKVFSKTFDIIESQENEIVLMRTIQSKYFSNRDLSKIEDVTFSPDSKLLAIFNKKNDQRLITIINLDNGKLVKEIKQNGQFKKENIKFISDNKIAAILTNSFTRDMSVIIYNF